MNDNQGKAVPLIERLRKVPADARLLIEVAAFHSRSIPVGPLCHEAAAALESSVTTTAVASREAIALALRTSQLPVTEDYTDVHGAFNNGAEKQLSATIEELSKLGLLPPNFKL
jgi:hypothetical protein